jgi:hypothetical protein
MQQRLFWILLLLVTLWACKKNSDSSIPETSSNICVFSLVQNVTGTPPVYDIKIDSTFIGTIGTGENTGYHSFQAKRYNLNIYHNGEAAVLASYQVSLRNGFHYSVFLSLDHNGTIEIRVTEDLITKPKAGYANLRVVDQSDSYYNGTSLSFGSPLLMDFYVDSVKVLQRLNYQAISGFFSIPKGTHTRDVRWADSTLSLRYTNDSTFTFEDGKSYSWIVYGNALSADSFKIVNFTHN